MEWGSNPQPVDFRGTLCATVPRLATMLIIYILYTLISDESSFLNYSYSTAAVKAPEQVDETVDPNKKQEELFQAMQAQYEVARATTHTMRGVGLGFQRGNF